MGAVAGFEPIVRIAPVAEERAAGGTGMEAVSRTRS
jgi:hypothetical protein